MLKCDFNCDMGEGMAWDALLMPYITSANIACGYHAGDDAMMLQTLLLAKEFNVKAGAHPSFPDRENFGRKEMILPFPLVYKHVKDQILMLKNMAMEVGVELQHVKPHGALYNMAAKDSVLASTIAQAVKDVDEKLVLFGLSGSCLISAAKALGLQTRSEVFADRAYNEQGFLVERSIPGALIHDENRVIQQVLEMVNTQRVTTINGQKIPIMAETVCLHGDGMKAVDLAKLINNALQVAYN